MSDLFGEVEYPKTVTSCHKEISRLEGLLVDAEHQLEAKDKVIDDLQEEIDDLEDAESDETAEDAIHAFLDECERVGPLRFDVPQSDRTNRAIVKLHTVVGRNP